MKVAGCDDAGIEWEFYNLLFKIIGHGFVRLFTCADLFFSWETIKNGFYLNILRNSAYILGISSKSAN